MRLEWYTPVLRIEFVDRSRAEGALRIFDVKPVAVTAINRGCSRATMCSCGRDLRYELRDIHAYIGGIAAHDVNSRCVSGSAPGGSPHVAEGRTKI